MNLYVIFVLIVCMELKMNLFNKYEHKNKITFSHNFLKFKLETGTKG